MSDPVADLIANGKPRLPRDEFGEFPWPDDFPPGKIGLVAGEQSRYTAFTASFAATMTAMPPNTGIQFTGGVDVCGNMNIICRSLKEHEKWIWVLGDDHVWAQGTLCRLLQHLKDGADIVVPHCLKRLPPWPPVVYSEQLEPDEDGREWYVSADLPKEGLTEVWAAGSAGMLIKREVIDALDDPFFRPDPEGEGLNEDVYFCQRAREAGFKIYCDPAILFGHISTHWVLPVWGEKGWDVHLIHDDDHAIRHAGIHTRIKRAKAAA